MRKCLVLFAVCIYSLISDAQNVGIGVPDPQNKLHVGGGFRLDTLTGVGGAGLLWHNPNGVIYGTKFTGNTNDVLRGDGTFGPYNPAINGALGWLLTGNSGTNPATNFLGTTDNIPFNVRVNNLRSGLIDPTPGNTSWGYQTLLSNTTGQRNTAVGNEALLSNVLGNDNTAIGYNALRQNIGAGNIIEPTPFRGVQNTAVGSYALSSNVTGSANAAFGANAMSLAIASQGSAFGAFTLEKNASFSSSAFGYKALQNNTNGNYNSAFGAFALSTNTTGYENTAVGVESLYNNNGYYNSALGTSSLVKNTSGHDNTALGYSAMYYNQTASFNTSVGAFSLYNNKQNNNTAIGYKALEQNNQGNANTAMGVGALAGNIDGNYNSAFGLEALRNNNNTDAAYNAAFGLYALRSNVSGRGNTAIGSFAGLALPNNVSNTTTIGYDVGWNTTSSNQVNIGNFNVTWIGGQTGWFHYSDKRIKNDIKDDVPGLAFITRLKPISYHVDIDKQEEIANTGKIETNSELVKPMKKDWEGKYDVEKIKMTGFFAQDVEEAAKEINYSFNGVHNPKNGGLYSLDYSAFVVPLVKAVQEQQKIIDDQNKKIDKQQQQIDLLIKEMQSLKKDLITQKN